MGFDLPADYKQVPERIADLKAKHPEASLQPADPAHPFQIVTVGGREFVVYTAACYRTPDDPRPGIGIAWEPFPGKTPYTRDSEMMNAETSAWGRAIVAALASESKAIASAEEVRNRQADAEARPTRRRPPPAAEPAPPTTTRRPPPANGGGPTCALCSAPLGTLPVRKQSGYFVHVECASPPASDTAPPAAGAGDGGEAGGPAAAGPPPANVVSEPQVKLMHVLLGKLGVPEDDKHRYVGALIDADVTSLKALTKAEGRRAIDALKVEVGE